MKRMNSMRLVGPTIIVLVIMAVGQIVAMDSPPREDFIELQRRIDTGDLVQVRQLVEQKNLKGHLNDGYGCKYFSASEGGNWLEHMPAFDQIINAGQPQGVIMLPSLMQLSALVYALVRYSEVASAGSKVPLQLAQNRLNIIRYFLEECQATFNRLPGDMRNQQLLVTATTCGDIEAVKLFIQHGMLQLPQLQNNGQVIDLLKMVRAGIDRNGNQVSEDIKAAYDQMLPYFEGPRFSFTAKNTVIVALAAAIVALGVKKAYDWFACSSEEQSEQEASEQSSETMPLAPEHVDPVGA